MIQFDAILSMAVVLFMIGFWTGLIPTDIFVVSGISGVATVMVYMILINNGTLLNLREFLAQWKTVALGLAIVIGGGALMFVIARPLIGQNLAVAIVGPITGGFVSGLAVSEVATPMGLTEVSLLATIIVAVQGVAGYPLGAFLLRMEAGRLLKGYRSQTMAWKPKSEEAALPGREKPKSWQFPPMPEKYQTSYILLAKLLIFAVIANQLSVFTGINGFILCLIVGKPLGFSVPMSLAVATTCMYGFPGTLILSEEIAGKVGETEEERQMLKDKILPIMLVSGFVTLTIVSVLIAGVFNRFLIAA